MVIELRVIINGREYLGSPEVVVGEMWGECFHRDRLVCIEEYIEHVAANVFRFTGIGIDISAHTVEEKSRQLIEGMVSSGLALKMDHWH